MNSFKFKIFIIFAVVIFFGPALLFSARPNSLTATKVNTGTNLLSWNDVDTNAYYVIYCQTNNAITEANKSSAIVLASNLSGSTHSFRHIMANYTFSNKTNEQNYFYAVTAYTGTAGTGGEAKLTLTTGMVVNEEGYGDAGNLVDEQATAGDPPTGSCPNSWNPGYPTFPIHAYIDLGSEYHITKIYIYDINNTGDVTYSSGSPGNWSDMFTYDGGLYQQWHSESVSVDSRYVRLTMSSREACDTTGEICIYGSAPGTLAETPISPPDNATTAGVANSASPAQLGSFKLSHSGTVLTNEWADVTVFAYDTDNNLFAYYSGSVTLDAGGSGSISWQNGTGNNGIFNDLGGGKCAYTFSSADNGSATFKMKDNTAENLNISAYRGSITDDNTEGLLKVVNELSGIIKVTVTFNSAPSTWDVAKAALKYNKKMAYSITFDDQYMSQYSNVFPFFRGGKVSASWQDVWGCDQGADGSTYPGLFFTDGCGNDIAFHAQLAIFGNSVGACNGYLTANQIKEMYNAGWDVANHSWDHDDSPSDGPDRDWECTNNQTYLKGLTGIPPIGFVIPSGDSSYKGHIFTHGIKMSSSSVYGGDAGHWDAEKQVDSLTSSDLQEVKQVRCFYMGESSGNMISAFDGTASKCDDSNHYWRHEGFHEIGNQNLWGIGEIWSDFKTYLQHIESSYGKSGNDSVWVAGQRQVYEYLVVRETSEMQTDLSGSTLTITLVLTNVPSNLRRYALSLIVSGNQSISSISVQGTTNYSYNTSTGLINLNWGTNVDMAAPAPQAPSITITAPAENEYVAGDVTIQATVSEEPTLVQYKVNSGSWSSMSGIDPNYSAVWDSTSVSDGTAIIYVRAQNATGAATNSISVNVLNNTKPQNLVATKVSGGRTKLTWNNGGSNGKYIIYCSTNGPITDGNKSSAIILETNYNITQTSFTHILANYPQTDVDHDLGFFYAVTVATGSGGSPSAQSWYQMDNSPSWAWANFNWPDWGTRDTTGCTALTFYMKSISGDNSITTVCLHDSGDNEGPNVSISTYASVGSDWTFVSIPIAALTSGIDATTIKNIIFKHDSSSSSSYGVDEIKFSGGGDYIMFDDSTSPNVQDVGSSITITLNSSGGYNNSTYFEFPLKTGDNTLSYAITNSSPAIPANPSALTIVSSTTDLIDLQWNDNSGNEDAFKVYWNTSDSRPASPGKIVAGGTGVTKTTTVSGLAIGQLYYFWVSATNEFGDSGYATASGSTKLRTLDTPNMISATVVSNTQIEVLWGNISNETSFTLYRNTVNNFSSSSPIASLSADVTNYRDTGLNLSTTYYYWVRAFGNKAISDISTVVSATTPTPPEIPVLQLVSMTSNSISIQWNDISNETSYTLFYSVGNTNMRTTLTGLSSNVITYIHTGGLNQGVTYYYWIKSYNEIGGSGYSSVLKVVLDVIAPTTIVNYDSGVYTGSFTAILTASDNAGGIGVDKIYYTTDGSDPKTSATVISGVSPVSIEINKSTILKYYAKDKNGNAEEVKTKEYTIRVKPTGAGVYPNVLDLSSGNEPVKIIFGENTTADIYIYTSLGTLVKHFTTNSYSEGDIKEWFGKDEDGDIVSSGIYIVVVKGDNIDKKFTVAVVK